MHDWSPFSWQNFTYQQQAVYADLNKLNDVISQLSAFLPLVTPKKINQLKQAIALAGKGHAFILQGGDCAEAFSHCTDENITKKLKILLQMSVILSQGFAKPIIPIGRMAGQYAKPRSSNTETINNVTLPCYRGDLINAVTFSAVAREPDPNRLIRGYHCAAKTLGIIQRYLNRNLAHQNHLKKISFYTSHEALHLHYEQALTRHCSDGQWYNLSTHLPWVGMRTLYYNSSHLELLRGVQNPIGIKIGPNIDHQWLTVLLNQVNPKREHGRLVLITRLGADNIAAQLPRLIDTVNASGIPVTWSCDPMHGNTEITAQGIKTRHFDNILSELKQAFAIHRVHHSHLGGMHIELTGEHVTECLGGARNLDEADLKQAYHSLVDPRLNYEQSLEIALHICRLSTDN